MTLLAAWGFGEGSGSTAADATGNGHTLTVVNGSWDASGHTGSALSNTAANEGASGTVPAITTAVTLMCWVKPLDLASGSTHAACGIFQAGGNTDVALFTQRGSFGTSNVLQADIRINGNLSACNGTSALTVGAWTHIAVTYDGTAIKLYRNGVLETTTNVAGSISLGTAFYVAGALTASGVDSDVVVDDVRLYDTALDQATISSLKDTPVGGTVTGTGSATAPPATTSGTGTIIVTGTGSATAIPAAVVGSGTVIVTGSGNATAQPAVAAGAGAVIVTGSGQATAPPAAVSGTGTATPIIDGSGNLITPTAIITGTGAVVITGMGSAVAPPARVAGFDQAVRTATAPRLTVVSNQAELTAVANQATAQILGGTS